MMRRLFLHCIIFFIQFAAQAQNISCIRINQLGYAPKSVKIAVLGCNAVSRASVFSLTDETTNTIVFTGAISNDFGKYGPFSNTYRLDFSSVSKEGKYSIRVNNIVSPVFKIDESVYDGAADFASVICVSSAVVSILF